VATAETMATAGRIRGVSCFGAGLVAFPPFALVAPDPILLQHALSGTRAPSCSSMLDPRCTRARKERPGYDSGERVLIPEYDCRHCHCLSFIGAKGVRGAGNRVIVCRLRGHGVVSPDLTLCAHDSEEVKIE
jgi:hypothetical protein